MSWGDAARFAVPWLPGLRLFWWPNSPRPKLDNHYHVKAAFHLSLGIATSHFNSSLCFWPIVTIVTPPAHYLSQLCRCLFPSAYPAAAPLSATDCRPLCVICPWVPSTAHLFSSDICIQPLRLCWIWGGNLSSNIIAIIYITITIIMIKMNKITRFQMNRLAHLGPKGGPNYKWLSHSARGIEPVRGNNYVGIDAILSIQYATDGSMQHSW